MRFIPSRLRNQPATAVAGLSVATAIGQGIAFIVTPVLARLTSPRDFAVYGVYIAAYSWMASIVCLRYEQAILLPTGEEEASGVFSVSAIAAVVVALSTLAVVLVSGGAIADALGVPELQGLLLYLPVGLLATGLYGALNFLALRRQTYRPVMRSRVAQGIGTAVGQVCLTASALGGGGLVVGDTVGRVAALIPYRSMQPSATDSFRSDRAFLWRLARRYRRFPLVAAPSSLVNSAGLIAPIIMLTALYGPATGGLYTLAQRIVGAPMNLVAAAVAQVYMAEFGRRRRGSDPTELRRLFRRYTVQLLKWGSIPVVLIALVAPSFFGAFLGQEWEGAGDLTRLLAPLFLADFVAYPLSTTLNLMERQGLQFWWDVGRLVAVVCVIAWCSVSSVSASGAVAATAVTLTIFYLALIGLGYRVLREPGQYQDHQGAEASA